jgi:hypothetical protein
MHPMLPRIAIISSALLVFLLLVTPVTATYTLTSVSYLPNPPLVPGGTQQVAANFYIGPSGATTFIVNHELQMQTSLTNARWNIQVIQNGRNAAQQSASGSAAFVNGAILSYSNNNDVTLSVTVNGIVPQTPDAQVMLLQVEEIDNSNNVVPGSIITLSQPVAGQTVTADPTVLPTLTPPVVPPAPTKSAGLPCAAAILPICLMALILKKRDG